MLGNRRSSRKDSHVKRGSADHKTKLQSICLLTINIVLQSLCYSMHLRERLHTKTTADEPEKLGCNTIEQYRRVFRTLCCGKLSTNSKSVYTTCTPHTTDTDVLCGACMYINPANIPALTGCLRRPHHLALSTPDENGVFDQLETRCPPAGTNLTRRHPRYRHPPPLHQRWRRVTMI